MKNTKIFEILINGERYNVYDREGVEHELGKMNGCPSTWWICYQREDRGQDIIDWIPFIDRGCNRISFEINIKQGNTLKYKWEDWDVRKNGNVSISLNGRQVYEFGFNDLYYAFSKAQLLTFQMLEHSFNFCNPEEMIGRKVYWKRQTGFIERLIMDQGCVIIKKDLDDGKEYFDTSIYPGDDEGYECNENYVKDDIFSKSIWWHRKG